MPEWQELLAYDPIAALLNSENKSIKFFVARDLLGMSDKDATSLWALPVPQGIVRKQRDNGSWKHPGGNPRVRSAENYNQIETYRYLGYLVELYGFDRRSPVIQKAADFIFGFQSSDGDIRGILGNQYTPYYTAGFVELLVKAGYSEDLRIAKAFKWLGSIRQDDGGWAIPLRTQGKKLDIISMNSSVLGPDRTKPFSHLVTGIVLRAYAAHPAYRNTPEAQNAANLLLSRLFKKDAYPDRSTAEFWLRFTYPFWFTDLVSALDTLSILGFGMESDQVKMGVQWLIDNQHSCGLWKLKTLKNKGIYQTDLWLTLAICRILKRLYMQKHA